MNLAVVYILYKEGQKKALSMNTK